MKRIVVDVDESTHSRVVSYAQADRRSIRQIMLMAVELYMRQNPVVVIGEEEREK